MPMPPEVRLRQLLQQVSGRLGGQAAARAACVGALVALVPFVFTRHVLMTAGAAVLTAIAHWVFTQGTRRAIAARVEARVPQCRNVLVTAEALLDGRLQAKPDVLAVVMHDAAHHADSILPSALWPWRGSLLAVAATAGLWVIALFIPVERLVNLAPGSVIASSLPIVEHVEIVVTPPPYTGRQAETFLDPERISALAGSRARVRITSTAADVTLANEAGSRPAVRDEHGRYTGDVVLDTDGYIVVTPVDEDGGAGARRLIGVTALPDRAPEVRVTEPGKDLFLREAATRLTVRLQAGDDLGLRSVRLAFTKVAGAGESFTFTEGEAPVAVTRVSDRDWTAVGVLPLDTMGLDVGDMVVYRGVALDGRPGAAPVESDAFIVEIVSASDAMAEGFSIDDSQDKYALSQQMVIIKTERLIAKAGTLSKEAVIEESLGIAAEQRSVRAEIVFMMGGEFEDEAVEAEHEHELSAGRLDNSGRADLGLATRSMSRAATQLIDGDLKSALATERSALVAMQRALSRRRFILRTLTQRGPIDESRRLQGRLVDLGRGARTAEVPKVSTLAVATRAALRAIADVSRQPALARRQASQLTDAAAGLLAADGRGAQVVDVASRLSAAAEAILLGAPDAARAALTDVAARLTAIASAEMTTAPTGVADRGAARLRGALADALRAGGGR